MIRFTIRRDKSGWRARLYSGSDLIWWTEAYERVEGARNAVRIAKESYNARLTTSRARRPSRRGEGRSITGGPRIFARRS